MRDFKKYFFESLIQLTVLANLLRQNSHHYDYINEVDYVVPMNTAGELDLLLSNQRYHRHYSINQTNTNMSLDHNYRTKEQNEAYMNTVRSLNRHRDLFVAPASFVSTSTNPKDLINLSETRLLLLNSIEFNNQLSKEDIEMDIELQSILQQDIDLGISHKAKSYNYASADCSSASSSCGYNTSTSSNDTSLDFDFLDYFDATNYTNANKQQQAQFKQLEQMQENQKNNDILATTGLFEGQTLPEGYKLVLEEDTGEWFLIMVANDSDKSQLSRIQVKDANLIASNNSLNQSVNNPVKALSNSVVAAAVENITIDFDGEQEEQPKFLSQVSINQELAKLNENLNLTNTTNLEDSLSILDENLLNETWINNFLDPNDPSQQQQQSGFQSQLKINNDKTLTSLNQNESILRSNENQTYIYTAPINHYQMNNFSNYSLFNNTEEIYADQYESIFDQAILNHEQALANAPNGTGAQNVDDSINLTQLLTFTENNNNNSSVMPNRSLVRINSVNTSFSQLLNISGSSSTPSTSTTTASSSPSVCFSNNQTQYNNTTSINSITITKQNLTSNDDKAKFNSNALANSLNEIKLKQETIELEENKIFKNAKASTLSNHNNNNNNSNNNSSQTPALTGLLHNHTYLASTNSEEESAVYHPYSYKNKLKKMLKNLNKPENETSKHESRDQQLLREHNIQLNLHQVVETTADEFNELIKELALNQEQINVVKDIRRRGKNKVAAQICRKRKLDSIDSLKEDVEHLRERKSSLITEYNSIHNEIKEMTENFDKLYKDAIGNSYDPNDPILVFINNLKDQLNVKDDSTSLTLSESKQFHSRHIDDSYHSQGSTLYNDDDDDEDDSDIEDDDDDENSQFNYSDDLPESRVVVSARKSFKASKPGESTTGQSKNKKLKKL